MRYEPSRRGRSQASRRVRRRFALAAALLLVAGAMWALAQLGDVLVVSSGLARPDAILSLASHEWERLPLAARLAQAYPDAAVLLTVPANVTRSNCHDCPNRVDRLRHLGVDPSRVHLLRLTGPGTHAEATAALGFARDTGIRRLLVATSPYHTRRSLALFRKVFSGTGIEVGVEPATATSPARPGRWWLAGYDRAYVAYETAAIAYYFWHYGVGPSYY
jgi:uncharacterized SAM-binding protein YcdF (DUF218 family)